MSIDKKSVNIIPLASKTRAMTIMGLGFVSIIIGFILTPSVQGILDGLAAQQSASQLLDINTFALVGEAKLGAPFVNAGIMLILVVITFLLTKTELDGSAIAAALMVFGFAFVGKNFWNVWPLFFGVLLHAIVNKKPINTETSLGWFATALAPLVSIFTLYVRPSEGTNASIGEEAKFSALGLVLGVIIGLVAGYLVATFASFLPEKHGGLTLYNAGFAAGLVGLLIFAIMKAIGLGHTGPGPWHEFPNIANGKLMAGIAGCLLYLLIAGLIALAKEKGNAKEIVTGKYVGNAVAQFGFGATMINMVVCGAICILYWQLTFTANVHTVFFAALFTVVGFAANGMSIRTMVPIMLGVYVASFAVASINAIIGGTPLFETAMTYVGGKNMLVTAMFGCGMAPVVYKHGRLVGFLAGAVHSIIVPNTAALHGWMNLYNNGFCIGIIVTFFVPMILVLLRRNRTEDSK